MAFEKQRKDQAQAESMDKKTLLAATVVLLSLVWSACTSDYFKRTAYEAAYQKGCVDRVATTNCDPDHKTYDQYAKERERMMRPDAR